MLVSISEFDKNGRAADPAAGFDIARPIADHKGPPAVDAEPFRGTPQHSRFGLAASAAVALAVITGLNCIDRKLLGETAMDLLDHGFVNETVSDIGLIGHDDQSKAGVLHRYERFACAVV